MPVYIAKAAGAAASGSVTLNATSESDPSKSMSVTCGTEGTVGGNVPATLVADAGHAGQLRPVHARRAEGLLRHHAANVTSTAGDATLCVADPSSTNTGHLVNGAFALPETLQANAVRGTTSGGVYAPVGGSAARHRC